jgi:flagellar hook-length control protein FliK
MIELSITAKNAASPPPATTVSGGEAGGFARAFEAFSDAPRPAEPRQRDAASGKELPAEGADPADKAPAKPATARRHTKSSAEPAPPAGAVPVAPIAAKPSDADDAPADDAATSDDTDKAAPIIAFFAAPIAPIAPIVIDPATLPSGAPRDAASAIMVAAPQTAPITLDASLATPPASGTPAVKQAATGTAALPAAFELIDAGAPSKAANAPTDPIGGAAPRIEAHTDTPRFAIAAAAVAADPATLAVQPARQAFATALAALSTQASMRAQARDDDSDNASQPIGGFAAPTASTLLQTAVQQVAAGDQAALDPRQDRGLHGMIDHIEMLRDDANARDTRIRLTPDALGTVDVALRRDGDAVHVRFSSANEATRLVLNDAQPRLAALAEARGVRIAGSSIDSGTGGGGQPQPQPRAESPRPARATRGVATTETDIPGDQRLA